MSDLMNEEERQECLAQEGIAFLFRTFDTYISLRDELEDKTKKVVDDELTKITCSLYFGKKNLDNTGINPDDAFLCELNKRITTYKNTYMSAETSYLNTDEQIVSHLIAKTFLTPKEHSLSAMSSNSQKMYALIEGGLQGFVVGQTLRSIPEKYLNTLIRDFDNYNLLKKSVDPDTVPFVESEIERIVQDMRHNKDSVVMVAKTTNDCGLLEKIRDMDDRIRAYERE